MSFGNDPWSDRIAAVNDDGPRRALLAEIGIWRAGRLTDIAAARQSTYALSRLHWLLRDKAAAEREARQLLSLCQTPPRASAEEIEAAKGWLGSLGASVPKVAPAPRKPRERRDGRDGRDGRPPREGRGREPREPRNKRDDRRDDRREDRGARGESTLIEKAVQAADTGDYGAAMKLLRGKRGGRADLVRVWVHLSRALQNDDPQAARDDLVRLSERLRGLLGPGALDVPVESAPRKKKAREEPAKPAEDKPAGPSPRELARQRSDALQAALTAEAVPEPAALLPLLEGWGRLWRAIAAAEKWDLDDARIEALLRAVDTAADTDRTIPGGTSLLIRRAGAGSEMAKTLLTTAPTDARYGGAGADVVVDLARAAAEAGWRVDRVLRGPTRKEVDRHAVLGTVGAAMDGLWRVLVRKDDAKAEIWYAAELPAEGRAGVPMLLLEEHARVVVLPIDPDLLGWYGSLEAPEAIGWTGEEGDALREALAAL